MSIIQISKIQQRSGDLVDLPQLDQAELGFASDVNKLFIGKTAGNTENIEVLTAYSNIAFSQLEGALGNLDINAPLSNGQVLVYNGIDWTNRGGNTGGYINLGEAENVSIDGGAIGYMLTTDGEGNLSWSPRGVVLQNIQTISAANPARLTLKQAYPFPQAAVVTINNIGGSGLFATNLNSNTYYLKTVPGNLQLYDLYLNSDLSSGLNTTTYGVYPANTGVIIWNTVSTTGIPGGANGSIQFNSEGVSFSGDNDLLYNYLTNTLTLNGTANITERINSGNLNIVTTANVGNLGASGFIIAIGNITGGNLITGGLVNATGNITGGNFTTAGVITATGNITGGNLITLGTLSAASMSVTGNITGGNLNTGGLVNATGNVSGGNVTTIGIVSATGNVTGGNLTTAGAVTATGNITGGNFTTAGAITATGNITGGNLITLGALSAAALTVTGNITGGNLNTGGIVNALGNITGANLNTGGALNVTGNASVGSLTSAGIVSAIGNVSGGNLTTAGVLNVTGNANVGNIRATIGNFTGNITTLNANLGNLALSNFFQGDGGLLTNVTANGTVANGTSNIRIPTAGGNVNTSVAGNANILVVTGTGVNVAGTLNVTGNANAGNLGVTGLTATTIGGSLTTAAQPNITSVGTLSSLAVTANITAGNVYANSGTVGANLLTGTLTTAAQPNITSVGTLTSLAVTGNITAGNVFANSGAVGALRLTGSLTTATQPNITSVGTLTSLTVTGNTTTGGVKTDNYFYANGVVVSFAGTYSNSNVQAYLPTYNGNVGTGTARFNGNVLSTGSSATAGTITGNWTLTAGSRLQATYADLAEYYAADQNYTPGTVLEFGGEKEVTLAGVESNKIAGVVSSEPAYVMNGNIQAEHPIMIALIGRAPVKVMGYVSKGDMLISAGKGLAKASVMTPKIGTVIGKAITNKWTDGEGTVEAMLGRT